MWGNGEVLRLGATMMKIFRRRESDADLSAVSAEDLVFTPSQTPATPDDLRWARLAEEARFSSLVDVQRTAERWGTTILVITGLLTTLTAVRGASDLASLRDMWPSKILVGSLSAAALLVALSSVVLAARAAQGHAIRIVASGPRLQQETIAATSRAMWQLSFSRWLAIAIIPLYLGALGVMAYSPQKDATPPRVIVQDKMGGKYCGNSARKIGQQIVVTGEKGLVAKISAVQLVSVTPAESCKAK
ncbi:hypothetical protein ACFUC2_25815 [[Kitasatospora] papulosa]|uniref:hypothetical protein n=1 Tax=[Kitasatospora] papulosa TaxID=1464011 RepID=UPI003639DF4F